MFCRKCGTKNADGAKFCINCGAELASPQPTAQPAGPVPPQATVPQATPVAPAGAPVPPQGAPQQPFQQTAYQQPATSVKKSKAPLVIGGVVAVLAVLAVVGFVVSATDTDDDEYPLYVRSTTLELDEDGTGYYEFASEWGKESDVAVADPTNSAYDPAGSGWKHPLTSSGSNGSYDVEFNDDTYNLTFTDGK